MMKYRIARTADLKPILNLFKNTIQNTCQNDYSSEQITVWISSIENPEKWIYRIQNQFFLIAESDNQVIGFASLEGTNYLDLMYVHHEFLRKGIANELYQKLEEKAIELGAEIIESDVSITARPFFERKGFLVLKTNKNIRKGVEIVNYRMVKKLN